MLEIMPVGNKDLHQRICSDSKTEYLPDSLAYYAMSDKIPVALCQFTVDGDRAMIRSLYARGDHCVCSERISNELVLAVFSFLDCCGVRSVTCCKDCRLPSGLLSCFTQDEAGNLYTEINGFLDRNTGKDR